jgi:hypothetical protein
MKWLDLLRLPTVSSPLPDEIVEVRPGTNVVSGKKIVLKLRVYRAAEGRWHDVPDEVSSLDGVKVK